jgi:hypothetical protein
MLAKNVEIIDIDPDQHERFFGMLPQGGPKKHGLIVFYSENRVFHAVHTKKGPIDGVAFRGPEHLAELAEIFGADYVICLEKNAIRRVAADAQCAVLFDDPLSAQAAAVYSALKREIGSGIHIYPDPFRRIPAAPPAIMRLARRFLLRNSLGMIVVFDDSLNVWISLILELQRGEISLISTTDFLEPLDCGDMGFDERAALMVRRLEQKRGRPTIGIFCDRAVFEHIKNHPRPVLTLLRMARLGWIRFNPFPSSLRILLRAATMLGL